MRGAKGVMRLPIPLGVRLEKRHDFVLALCRQELREADALRLVEVEQLCKTNVWEVLWAHAE